MRARLLIPMLLLLLLPACSQGKVKQYKVRVVKEYPHDTSSYTQGLFFHDGRKYFVEGSVILGDELFILTWTNKVAFKYDAATLQYKSTHGYPREGWGLTTDGKQLIASDGSANLYFMDTSFNTQKTLKVTLEGRPVRYLNELEWIDGRIWANVYTTDLIVVIDPKTGVVEATVDCAGLLPRTLRDDRTDVLNGIAVNDGKIYLTGKYWKRLYEIETVAK